MRRGFRVLVPLLLATVQAIACQRSPWPPPPETHRDEIVDTLHGVELPDPYRWLEAQDDPEVRVWLEAQREYADTVLRPTALRARFATRLGELMGTPDAGDPRRAGDWEYFTLRRQGEEVASIYRRPRADPPAPVDPDGEYEKIVDPLAIDPSGTTSVGIQDISEDGRLLMYSVRDGGPDEIEIRVLDIATRVDLPDRLPAALYGSVSFEDEGRAIRYVHRSREAGPRLKRHRLGTSIEADSVLWGEDVPPTAFISVRDGLNDRYRIYTVQHGWASVDMYLQDLRANGPVVPLAVGLQADFSPQFTDGRLLVLTNLDAPRNRIVEIDPASPGPPDTWKTVLPEGEHVIDGFTRIGDRFYITIIDDVAHRILVHDDEFRQVDELELPPWSSASIRPAGEGKARLTVASLAQPSITWLIDTETGERTEWDRDDVPFDPDGVVVEQVWYTSKDGTRAPMYVMHRDDIVRDGENPALLHGYGGFNVSLMPRFDARAASWIEEGGVYAVATLRGGGEYGEEWHRAGMLENKQNVFDDFIAAAEALVAASYTRPGRIAIRGGSNGGLLMGAAITQRPDLFGAAFVGVPDLDMTRFYRYTRTNNLPALLEYGNGADPAQFAFLHAHSPYDNVREGTDYPAVLIHTGDLDTRVPPAQARKFTARLQAATRSGRPIVLHYDERMGHAGGRPHSHVVEDAATELAFLMEHAGFPDGNRAVATAAAAAETGVPR